MQEREVRYCAYVVLAFWLLLGCAVLIALFAQAIAAPAPPFSPRAGSGSSTPKARSNFSIRFDSVTVQTKVAFEKLPRSYLRSSSDYVSSSCLSRSSHPE